MDSETSNTLAEVDPSEFGRGIVVCLAKFSEHLQEHGSFSERMIREYAALRPEDHARLRREASKYPNSDAAAKLLRLAVVHEDIYGSKEACLSHLVVMWMNAASDHFYDLDPRAPAPLKELAALTIHIGHGFGDEVWTLEHVDRIRVLWRESCLAVDRALGLEPDWGAY